LIRRRIGILTASLALLFVSLACAALLGAPPPLGLTSPETLIFETPTPTPTPLVEFCPPITDAILELASSYDGKKEVQFLDGSILLVNYEVIGEKLDDPSYTSISTEFAPLRNDTEGHLRIWNYFRALIPASEREMLAEYAIGTDGDGGHLAAVGQTDNNAEEWLLFVDIADTSDYYELTYTFVHEFAHLLTLGPEQVPPSLAVFEDPYDEEIYEDERSDCDSYFPGPGCARANSYIHAFYERFWPDMYDEWQEIDLEDDEEIYYGELEDFYLAYEDRFVTQYAATSPEEDIAESFSFFIFSPKPSGAAIAEEKILFFYEYPELIELRTTVLNNVCAKFPKE
jgi:hypothetical protein